ncbi:MAG TPA: DegT/DnrJ/EryC1/StrS family aminotransferase [Sedimentisphaerales bacterium]|nr:DegT/DnrJ/EryC1/StrS family aminotransferase [Sedimentisphaerales bacterium]HNU31612.1 DegT/DnrJ/EryC1/StrS family aminotransferase [Sedimentisphaerales bacterium]
MSRRQFVGAASAGTFAAFASRGIPAFANAGRSAGKLAILGGTPVRAKPWPAWPVWDRSAEESVVEILRSGNWFRGQGTTVTQFEKAYADLLGVKRCVAMVNGTNSLLTALFMLDIGVGDEVIVSPYTFIATYNVVINSCALPVFADTDPETFQINPDTIEKRITENTRAILPVHILGIPANMDRINEIAKKHNLRVIEDACQAWLAQWRGKSCGTLGDLGCFSFQNSKHLPCGEGGAVVGNDEELMDRVHAYHNCGRAFGNMPKTGPNSMIGTNRRMTEYQAAILLNQMKRLEADTELRWANGQYLTSKIKDIPGVVPHKLYEGVTRAVYHLYPFRYLKEHFNNAPREKFLAALSAEGIPCSGGYGPQYNDGLIEAALNSKNFKRAFSKARLDRYRDELHYPGNDQLCKEAVWIGQNMLLTGKQDMDDIANAIAKIYENRDKLA